ncbi:MAG: glutamate--tRNA ligase [Betaproteobacteria bacterium]|nr:MAG: glutamate--tRNA ligase [Betaproteobacteria bacterium]
MTTVRTRFAPSPTGFLHLGSARTALFAWAFARRHRGTFILRIEDTDVERSTQEAVQAIFDAMSWLGLDYDEGPFFQIQRMDRYRAVIDEMLARGLAYHCYTSPQELDALRAAQMARGEKPRYDGRWRPENIAANGLTPPPGVKPVVRFRNPDEGSVVWNDAVKGTIEIANAELDDLVVARSDGTPTYNFCVVVDDLDMRITHVVRGDDHVNNTPRQINMILALGAAVPSYAHLPTVLGDDGHKLSKRHGAVSVMQYEEEGFLPEALINFLARLGWAHGDDEVFTRDELVAWFDIAHVNPAPARFDADKLRWLNHEHMKRLAADELGRRLQPFLERAGLDLANGPPVEEVAMLLRDRTPTLVEMADAAHYFYATPHVPAEKLAEFVTAGNRPALVELYESFATLPWSRESIGAALKSGATKHGLKPPQIMMALRMIVTGTRETPAIDAVLAPLGRDATRARMKARLEL